MKVAIFDIDDTIVEETNFMKRHAVKFIKKHYNIEVTESNPNGYDVKEVYGLEDYFLKKGYSTEESIKRSEKINKHFWNKNFIKYCMQNAKPGVKETINYLRENGYKIHFVSARGKPTTNKEGSIVGDLIRLKIVPLLTKIQLLKSGIKYDVLKLVKSSEEKIDYISHMSPDFVFEDQANVINNIKNNGIIFCIDAPHNEKSVSTNDHVLRIKSLELRELKESIENVIKNDKVRKEIHLLGNNIVESKCITNTEFLKKILTESTYTIIKLVGTPIFNKKYKPIIKGNENIIKKGAVAFVGNHRDKLDPVLVTASQNRKVHWGALLRMFQGKENLFSAGKHPIPCYASAAFITAMGAVPIARKSDNDNFRINLKSMEAFYQTLVWEGAVGLFPEGTLNREPEKYNILPLKSNRIFKLVKNSGGLVQPFSITWIPKNTGIDNRVIINYSIPINTRNKSLKEIADMWEDTVNEGIESSKELIETLNAITRTSSCKEETDKKVKTLVKQFINK
ncbi:MAG: HAD hydrolase-like protein [bacterium]|nr:HAD hydrolase-like protein [bacterium]